MSENKNSPLEHSGIKAMYYDELTQKKIHEHLNNEKDVITEQDIANISIGIVKDKCINLNSLFQLQDHEPATGGTEMENIEDKKIRDNENPEINTAWNILGS